MAMPKDDDYEGHRITKWAIAFRRLRAESGRDHHTIADYCGCSKYLVREWENGDSVPNRHQYKQLCVMFRGLEKFEDIFPKQQPTTNKPEEKSQPLKASIFTIVQQHRAQEPPKTQRSEPEPKPEPTKELAVINQSEEPTRLSIIPRTFGVALRGLREQSEISPQTLAKLMGVTPSSVYSWEHDGNKPVLDHYNKLVEIFPGLKLAPKPSTKDIPKPDSSGTPKSYAVNQPTPPTQSMPPVPPSLPPQPKPNPKPDFAQLGSTYAEALRRVSLAQVKVDELTAAVVEADDELKRLKIEMEQAHEALKKATGAS